MSNSDQEAGQQAETQRSGQARWMVASASVAGSSHRRLGREGDDAHAWAAAPGERLFFAVADGVGSASASATGSLLAAETALDTLILSRQSVESDDPEAVLALLRSAFHNVAGAVTAAADREGLLPSDLGTTLCCGVLTPDWCAVAQIGDGAVVIATPPDGEFSLLLGPQDIGTPGLVYSAGDLRDDDLLRKRMTTAICGPVVALAVTTDGLLNVAFRDEAPYPPFFQPLVAAVGTAGERKTIDDALQRFLTSERVARAASDDLTLIVIADTASVPALARRWAAERAAQATPASTPSGAAEAAG